MPAYQQEKIILSGVVNLERRWLDI